MEQTMMRAMVQRVYGSPARVLQPTEIRVPEAGPGEVLVRVRAASVQVGAYFAVLGTPFLVRLFTGIRRPRFAVPGFDVAGEVVSVGPGVTRFRPGDEVFGAGTGALAEYATIAEKALASKPQSISFDEAAAIPTSGLAALHGLRAARAVEGQRLLINGASGAVGTFVIQIAKSLGLEVTAVCSSRNLDLVRSLGADHEIDYTTDDFTRTDSRYDIVFDNVENRSLAEVRRVLRPRGTYVLNSGTGVSGLRLLGRLIRPVVLNPFVSQRLIRYVSNPKAADLEHLAALVEQGKLRPAVGRRYPLAESVSAFELIGSRHAQGAVVVTVAPTA
jgi:NADPH:quinone reductase-like Zn-dependent oxidoreductase